MIRTVNDREQIMRRSSLQSVGHVSNFFAFCKEYCGYCTRIAYRQATKSIKSVN